MILPVSLALDLQALNVPLVLAAYSLILQYIHAHKVVLLANIEITPLILVEDAVQAA